MNKKLLIKILIALIIVLTALILMSGTTEPKAEEKLLETKISTTEPIWQVDLEPDIQLFAYNTAEHYGLDADLVMAVISIESNFDVDAIGDEGESIGLMQVQSRYHKDRMERLEITDLTHPYHNIMVGCDYLAELSAESNDLNWILTAYNAGRSEANFQRELGVQSEYAEQVQVMAELLRGARNV